MLLTIEIENWKLLVLNKRCCLLCKFASMQTPSTTHDLDTLSLVILLVIS